MTDLNSGEYHPKEVRNIFANWAGRSDDRLKATADAFLALYLGGHDYAIDDLSERAIARGIDPNAVQLCAQQAQERAADPELRKKLRFISTVQSHLGTIAEKVETLSPLQWLDMSNWDNEPVPERQWSILNRVPLNQAGLFSGEGGTGKSILELHKDVAHVVGKDWLGSLPEPGPAFYIGAEDDKQELHIRLAAIAKHCRVTFSDLIQKGLRVLPLLGQDATLCAVGKSGRVEVTGLYKQLYEAAGDLKPKNISIDTLSRAFAGSEIDRVQVYAFAQHMQALAMVAEGSVTILSHPSLNGINSGSGISGSTAWHGAFRFRQYLTSTKPDAGEQPDNDLRQLEFKKNQYGPTGETIVLRYQNGLFLPVPGVGSLERVAAESKIDDLFLELLLRFEIEKRPITDRPCQIYAPLLFAKEPEGKAAKVSASQFEASMRRLFAAGKIINEVTGPPSRQRSRLVLK